MTKSDNNKNVDDIYMTALVTNSLVTNIQRIVISKTSLWTKFCQLHPKLVAYFSNEVRWSLFLFMLEYPSTTPSSPQKSVVTIRMYNVTDNWDKFLPCMKSVVWGWINFLKKYWRNVPYSVRSIPSADTRCHSHSCPLTSMSVSVSI